MAGVIEDIDKRTQLAGNNRLEILMFYLGNDKQLYGINVFKVQEVIICPDIRVIPDSMRVVDGIVDIRGTTIPVIDLSMAIGKTTEKMTEPGYLIVSEYNKRVQGFRVTGVDRIVNMNWEDIKPPPKGLGQDCYLTAITQVDERFVEIIDVEKIISELNMVPTSISDETIDIVEAIDISERFVLIVDDSLVARKQISIPLDKFGIKNIHTKDGKEALNYLNNIYDNDYESFKNLAMVISDVEMPVMDGYTLVSEIRKSEKLRDLHVILHSSLSGVFNEALVKKVGADKFIAKYDADILTQTIVEMFD